MKHWVLWAIVGVVVLALSGGCVAALALKSSEPSDGASAEITSWPAADIADYAAGEDSARAARPIPSTTTTTAPPTTTTAAPPTTAPRPSDDSNDSGTSGADPDLLANTPPPPSTAYDPFANCPHRWQRDVHGNLIDTGCASEPHPITPVPTLAPNPTTTTTIDT